MKLEHKNILHACECGCKTPIIQEHWSGEGAYRVVCPMCKNGEEEYFSDSEGGSELEKIKAILEAIDNWNDGGWKWNN